MQYIEFNKKNTPSIYNHNINFQHKVHRYFTIITNYGYSIKK